MIQDRTSNHFKPMTISQLAQLAELPVSTIRYYEKQGLIASSQRSKSKYRLYNQSALARLVLIKNAKTVGFSLQEIRELIQIQSQKHSSEAIKQLTQKQINRITKQIDILTSIKSLLTQWDTHCTGQQTHPDNCPILQNMTSNSLEFYTK